MLSLSELLIQSPEDLYNIEGSSSNWIREITTWWGHGSDNRNRSNTRWRSEASNLTSSLVELSQLWTQMCWETRISGHLCKTSRDLSESLSPSWGGISHHSNIVSLISEVLSQCNTSINGSLSGSHRHVWCVCYQAGSLHNTVFFAIKFDLKLWELIEYLCHLISSFTASYIDNTLRVGIFGQSLWNASFSATEGTWNSACSTEDWWVEGIKHSLSGKKWLISLELLNTWSWGSNGPEMRHAQLLLFSIDGLIKANWLRHGVLSIWVHFNNSSVSLWISHDRMVLEKGVLVNITQFISTSDQVSNLKIGVWMEIPKLILVQTWELNSSWDEHTVSLSSNLLKRSLDTIENCLQNSWSNINKSSQTYLGRALRKVGFLF